MAGTPPPQFSGVQPTKTGKIVGSSMVTDKVDWLHEQDWIRGSPNG